MYKFFLNFKNNEIGRFQISEPHGFDVANFVLEQDSKRYGRDVSFCNEEISLEFYKDVYEPYDGTLILPDGNSVDFLTHGYDYLIEYYNTYGFESEVEFIIQKDDVDFIQGVLDFAKAETDEYSYFKTKVIQNTAQAIYKRREDVKVDLFSEEDLNGNPITPISTKKILLKAKPVAQSSEWAEKRIQEPIQFFNEGISAGLYLPLVNSLSSFGIENSYAPFDISVSLYEPTTDDIRKTLYSNRLITATETLKDVKVKIKNLSINGYTTHGKYTLILGTGIWDAEGNYISNGSTPVYYFYQSSGAGVFELENQDYELDIPIVTAGESLYLMNIIFWGGGFVNFNMYYQTYSCDGVTIEGSSIAKDSVTEGSRYIDVVKQVSKSINGFPVNSPKYDIGGEFYNNFVFNGKLIRQFKDKPFYSSFKDCIEQLQELNSDYQVNKDSIYVGQYSDYYNNNDIGAFIQIPNNEFKSDFNDRYSINTVEYKYKSFEQDRDEKGTIDAVHTDTQWLLPNEQVENNLKIEVPFVRDPFEIESSRRQSIYAKKTTSLSSDDKTFIIDVVELPPNSRGEFNDLLPASIIGGFAVFFSTGRFNWELLGFRVGDIIQINYIDCQVISMNESTLSVLAVSGSFDAFFGYLPVYFNYPLTDVQYVNRTSEEFQNIENISSPNNYSNLQYTIKRNLKHWFPYIKTACKYVPNEVIRNTYFKSNGELITEFRNGGNIKENENINVSELDNAFITPKIYTTTVVASFDEVLSTLQAMQTINPDGSIGGFIRIADNNNRLVKVYPKKIDFSWATNELTIEGEEKNEGEAIKIETIGTDLIRINEVGYDEKIVKPLNYKTNGDYCQIFDYKGIPLTSNKKYNFYFVNSNNFSNIVELADALSNL